MPTGELLLDGKNMLDQGCRYHRLRAKVGMVFQKPTPFPMSIYENIAFGVRLHERLTRNQMEDRVEWALRKAALWDEVKDKLNQSGTESFRRAAAAPVHCPWYRRQAASVAAR